MRTDRRRLRPLLVDAPATTALRQTVRARRDPLRAHLQIVFPGAVGLFADVDSDISLRSWNASEPTTAPRGSR